MASMTVIARSIGTLDWNNNTITAVGTDGTAYVADLPPYAQDWRREYGSRLAAGRLVALYKVADEPAVQPDVGEEGEIIDTWGTFWAPTRCGRSGWVYLLPPSDPMVQEAQR